MENKENPDIFSIVANTTIRWYEQTHTTMTISRVPPSLVNSEFMGILLAAKKQTEGALTTLANKNILSTHALLRVLVETFVVLKWVLNAPANEENTKSAEVYKRFRRWDYTRLTKDKKLLENLPRNQEIESALEKVKSDIKKLETDGIKGLPPYKQLYNDILGEESAEMYAKTYRTYSRAVHLDRNVTQELARIQYEKGEPKSVLYKDDIEADGDELLIVASVSCDINKAIRGFYDWHSDAMQNEYEQLRSRLVKK
ncbi:MAG: DUF5677 domain-containing protein [Planctomycetota bacterium]|jgi:hypothetical protein